jgi:hypothetical protein
MLRARRQHLARALRLWAVVCSLLGIGLALLPELPRFELCCLVTGEEMPGCCPPEERAEPVSLESTCCQHLAFEARAHALLLPQVSPPAPLLEQALVPPSFRGLLAVPVSFQQLLAFAPETGPPPRAAERIYLRHQTFLI